VGNSWAVQSTNKEKKRGEKESRKKGKKGVFSPAKVFFCFFISLSFQECSLLAALPKMSSDDTTPTFK
jgi:hypothetical protein